ncbi:MAG: hypothetical protein ABJZ90_15685 [Paracoccaceae bacterium]|uniref:hypothetical protein n=1 Tax=Tateyamaria sp. TaxID=1929288 RepID=UPI00329F8C2F
MLCSIQKYTHLVALALLATFVGTANRVHAQTYQIDCAILLCLSDGWPTSVPCARARAEFIRRITPWPIEPPLQIWRCPMGASYDPVNPSNNRGRFYDILFTSQDRTLLLLLSSTEPLLSENSVLKLAEPKPNLLSEGFALDLVQDRADIDISGPEFNFVRSIRVFDVRYARQNESGRDRDCNRSASIYLGTYGTQGEFSWARSGPTALPEAHTGLERWGYNCPSLYHRSVFVDWSDYEGNYGFEQVNY